MNFELLPNEIILDLFEYIPIVHLFHAFFNLNSRFNQLLCLQRRKFHFDFRLLSKTKFHYICENYIPLVIDRISSVNLSNDENTPQQIELFLSQPFQLRQFTHLQSIKILDLRSCETLDQIMNECSYLSCLTHLTFIHGYIPMDENEANNFYNHIWSLKNLIYCYLDISFAYQNYFPKPTVISTSLTHLTVQRITSSSSTLTYLFQQTPNLEYLSTSYENYYDSLELISPIQSITRLNIRFSASIDILHQLLQNLPNLRHLTCEAIGLYIAGHQWEEIIRKYLPKLEIFQFKMKFLLLNGKDGESELNEIIGLYRTKFWIEEHRWFVQCHWYKSSIQEQYDYICLFTLPYVFRNIFDYNNNILAKSTSPSDKEYLTLINVSHLYYRSRYFTSSVASRFRFDNIENLTISLPFNDQFLSIVSKFDRLTSLNILVEESTNLDNNKSQLQLLLDRALRLRSLSFGNWLQFSSSVPLIGITSASVRQLNLGSRSYDDEQCSQLIRSPLGKQCETLMIEVKNRRSIVDLVNNMPNLQVLNFQSEDDAWSDENYPLYLADEELVEWLHRQLPLVSSIWRDTYEFHHIILWIR